MAPSSKWLNAGVGIVAYLIGLALFVGREDLSVTHASELRARIREPAAESLHAPEQLEGVDLAYANNYLDAGTVDIAATMNQGERAYLNTLVDLLDPAFVSERRLDCADKYAGEIRGACSYRIEMLVRRKEESQGRITHARTFLHEVGSGGIPSDSECSPYVKCLAEIRLGESVRIPDNGEPRLGLALELQSSWATPDLFDLEYTIRLRESWQQNIDFHGPDPSFETPAKEFNYEFTRRLVPYLGLHIKRLKRAAK